ncbi:hypothetical protein GCM10023345_18710 [Acinetobacter kookii]|uniref:Uncharacterized protein n=2 Tax=Acinetobacter TaxID=469 RepID=A0A1G6JVN2_9GAMM|nr:hypothetical protein [Acinetobacter kookii]SDC22691.1 hypothetical protein SAMN05421732_10482 [Acinetobacter kookii]
MLNNTYILFGAVLGLTIANAAGAATISMKNDRLGYLIQQVDYQHINDSLEKSENRLLGRASWDIQCWVKSSENTKICTMRKNHITVMRMNDSYSLSVGINHAKNSITLLKVDNNSVLQAREGLYRDAQAIIDQFKRGFEVKTEFNVSHNAKPVVNEVSLIGFSDAFNDMQQQYSKLNHLDLQRRL